MKNPNFKMPYGFIDCNGNKWHNQIVDAYNNETNKEIKINFFFETVHLLTHLNNEES